MNILIKKSVAPLVFAMASVEDLFILLPDSLHVVLITVDDDDQDNIVIKYYSLSSTTHRH